MAEDKYISPGQSGVFRPLAVETPKALAALADSFYWSDSDRQYKQYGLRIDFTEKDSLLIREVENESYYGYYRYRRQEAYSISWMHYKGKMHVKCEECDRKVKTFCKHQKAVFATLSRQKSNVFAFLCTSAMHEQVVDKAAQAWGLSVNVFNTYYSLFFDVKEGRIAIQAKDDRITSPEWFEGLLDTLGVGEEALPEAVQQMDIQKTEEGRQPVTGFVWLRDDQSNLPRLKFLNGYSLKTKPGIHSQDRFVTSGPTGLDAGGRLLAEELLGIEQERDPRRVFELYSDFLIENREELNQYLLYVPQDEYEFDSKFKTSQPLEISPDKVEASFELGTEGPFLKLKAEFKIDQQPWKIDRHSFDTDVFCLQGTHIHLYSFFQQQEIFEYFQNRTEILIPKGEKARSLYQFLEALPESISVHIDPSVQFPEEEIQDIGYAIYLTEVHDTIVLEPWLLHGDESLGLNDRGYYDKEIYYRVPEKDREFLIEFMNDSHEDFAAVHPDNGKYALSFSKLMNKSWFLHFADSCKTNGIELLGADSFKKFKYNTNFAKINTRISSGIDWFDVDVQVEFGNETVSTKKWVQAIRNGLNYVVLKDGTLGLLPEEWVEKMTRMLSFSELEKDGLAISKLRYNVLDELFDEQVLSDVEGEVLDLRKRIETFTEQGEQAVAKSVNADLRDYQLAGYQWLKFLDQTNTGGILADEMGLGKTLQAIALLADHADKTSLVVVPRSLLGNWAREIDKFCPSLSYYIHHGTLREKGTENFGKFSVIITTYGTAVNDAQLLHTYPFELLILDESQAIKNISSKRYKAIRLFTAKTKIAMTGTPIENNTFDLYAQMSFACPGLLGSAKRFKEDFTIPIDANGDKEQAKLLTKLVHPFMLRRTKEQVAKDLPSRTETVVYCEMDTAQQKLYNNLKSSIRADLLNEVSGEGWKKSQFKILEGLLRLRQMCNSPLLVNAGFKGKNKESVKLEYLMRTIQEDLGNHSALIFSQFTSMLALLRERLDAEHIPYAYLDGATTNRQEVVDRFENDPNCQLFLLSLKAGNTGLNLTKADYVYLIDPWWNPAVEAQAIDRTHRIGQEKPVFAYRLICKGTVEEKILALQQKKKALASDLIKTDEGVFKNLSKADVLELFE